MQYILREYLKEVQMVVAKQVDACLVALKAVGATLEQGVACTDQTAGLTNVGEMHPLFVVVQMLLQFDPSAPSPSDQSNFVSVALQTAGSTAAHLPGSSKRQGHSKMQFCIDIHSKLQSSEAAFPDLRPCFKVKN
jgi:hypothetical protein